jgi:hypothetical protein
MKLKKMGVSKGLYTMMLENFQARGGSVFSKPETGMTVAVRPCRGMDSKFCEVSLAFCDTSVDKFQRKTGIFLAIDKWESGEFVKVPMFGNTAQCVADYFFEVFGETDF